MNGCCGCLSWSWSLLTHPVIYRGAIVMTIKIIPMAHPSAICAIQKDHNVVPVQNVDGKTSPFRTRTLKSIVTVADIAAAPTKLIFGGGACGEPWSVGLGPPPLRLPCRTTVIYAARPSPVHNAIIFPFIDDSNKCAGSRRTVSSEIVVVFVLSVVLLLFVGSNSGIKIMSIQPKAKTKAR